MKRKRDVKKNKKKNWKKERKRKKKGRVTNSKRGVFLLYNIYYNVFIIQYYIYTLIFVTNMLWNLKEKKEENYQN